jgi:RNase P subunit RPR2
MGEGVTVECPHCSRKRTFILGVGMEYSSLENILPSVQRNHRREIEQILNNNTVTNGDCTHRLFVCDQCHHLIDRLHVKLTYDSNQVYETVFHCQECEAQMRQPANLAELANIPPCSRCGRKSLRLTGEFYWD